jgi:hypothetical protein
MNQENTRPVAVQREWMDIPWKERNILSKICYVFAIGFGLAIGLGLLWLAGSAILRALKIELPPELVRDWWLWPIAFAVMYGPWLRWLRLLVFISGGAMIGGSVLPIVLEYHVTNVEGFLIGAGICSVVSALCIFAPHREPRQANKTQG